MGLPDMPSDAKRVQRAAREGKFYDPEELKQASEKFCAVCTKGLEEMNALREYANATLLKVGKSLLSIRRLYLSLCYL